MTLPAHTMAMHSLRSRLTKVCVALTGATAAEMIERGERLGGDLSFVEFRLDYLRKPGPAIPELARLLSENSEMTAIATCRREAGGGKFAGSVREQLAVLEKAAASGFHIVDVELETVESLSRKELDRLRHSGAALLISYHDFAATRELDSVWERIRSFEPDFIKIVSTAKHLADNVAMLRFLEHTSDQANVVGVCMGEAGTISRVLGLRSGSLFTFAAATAGEETAPGQVSARTLIDTYRIGQVDRATRVYGVAGNPVRHSLSPLMMNAAFRRESVNAVFLPLETKKLSDLLKLVHEVPIQGLSVTMPLKQEIVEHLEKTDPISARIGASNTLVRSADGKLYGFNTDVSGIVQPLERRLKLRGAKVLVLGAGGAARAAVFALTEKGAEVSILNRTPETARTLARAAKAKTMKREQLAKRSFDVIIHSTPAGMEGSKVASILKPEELNARLVFDMVYNPVDTPLVRMAREKGLHVITGVEMFVQQGARQFEIWTGKPAPEGEMLRVVLHALRSRAEAPRHSV